MRILDVEVFATEQVLPIAVPSPEYFNGLLLGIQLNTVWPYYVFLILIISILIALRSFIPQRLWRILTLSLTSLLSICLSFKLSQGWDELFINLKHSYVFRETGRFSYNLNQMLEGTVDFLPFMVTGLLGKLGLPLFETIIVITLFGNVLVIWAGWLIAKSFIKDEGICAVFTLGLGIIPCVVYVGATGFTATLFSGWILFIMYFLFFAGERHRWAGLILLAFLTAVRTEGIALAFLIWIYLYVRPLKGTSLKAHVWEAVRIGAFLAAPFLIMTFIRMVVFGYPLPNPITFKNTGGNHAYFAHGLHRLRLLIDYYHLNYYFFFAIIPFIYCVRKRLLSIKCFISLIILSIFCFLYFTGGGDWFPGTWSRYLMPFTLLFILSSWIIIQTLFASLTKNIFILMLTAFFMVLFPFFSNSSGSVYKTLVYDAQINKNRWDRVDHLAYFGRYLNQTTSPSTIIGSPEMATVMFFAQRDLLDLLGIANPEVAHAQVNPILPADLMHRRRYPPTIEKHRPGILALYGMVQMEPFDFEKFDKKVKAGNDLIARFIEFQTRPDYKHMITRFDIAFYRAGHYQRLVDLGYRYLIVATPKATFYYMVHASILDEHTRHFAKYGITKIGSARIEYDINHDLEKQFKTESGPLDRL